MKEKIFLIKHKNEIIEEEAIIISNALKENDDYKIIHYSEVLMKVEIKDEHLKEV